MATTFPQRPLLFVLFCGVFMSALDVAIVAPALPLLRSAFAIDNRLASLFILIYALCSLASTAPLANLSDRYGRRLIYLGAVGGFALGSLLVALAPSFPLALLGRALQGVSAGGITPAASAVVGDSFPLDQCGKALGLIGATFGMAFVLGPLLASAILVILPWPWLFLINLPVAAGIIAVGLRTLPAAQRSTAQPPFDLVGSLVGLLLLTCLVLGLNQVLDPFIGVTLWPWLLAGASGLLLLFLRVEQRAVQPIMPFDVSRNRQIRLVYLLTIGAGFAMGSVVYVASLAVMAFGIAEQQAGLLLLPLVLASSVGSVLFGR